MVLLTSRTPPPTLSASSPIKPSTTATPTRDLPISRRRIEHLIAQGHLIVIVDTQILKLDGWVEKHPGGRLPLMHMVGVDASCEVAA